MQHMILTVKFYHVMSAGMSAVKFTAKDVGAAQNDWYIDNVSGNSVSYTYKVSDGKHFCDLAVKMVSLHIEVIKKELFHHDAVV